MVDVIFRRLTALLVLPALWIALAVPALAEMRPSDQKAYDKLQAQIWETNAALEIWSAQGNEKKDRKALKKFGKALKKFEKSIDKKIKKVPEFEALRPGVAQGLATLDKKQAELETHLAKLAAEKGAAEAAVRAYLEGDQRKRDDAALARIGAICDYAETSTDLDITNPSYMPMFTLTVGHYLPQREALLAELAAIEKKYEGFKKVPSMARDLIRASMALGDAKADCERLYEAMETAKEKAPGLMKEAHASVRSRLADIRESGNFRAFMNPDEKAIWLLFRVRTIAMIMDAIEAPGREQAVKQAEDAVQDFNSSREQFAARIAEAVEAPIGSTAPTDRRDVIAALKQDWQLRFAGDELLDVRLVSDWREQDIAWRWDDRANAWVEDGRHEIDVVAIVRNGDDRMILYYGKAWKNPEDDQLVEINWERPANDNVPATQLMLASNFR